MMVFLRLTSVCQSCHVINHGLYNVLLQLDSRVWRQNLRRLRLLESSNYFPMLGWTLSESLINCSIIRRTICFSRRWGLYYNDRFVLVTSLAGDFGALILRAIGCFRGYRVISSRLGHWDLIH